LESRICGFRREGFKRGRADRELKRG